MRVPVIMLVASLAGAAAASAQEAPSPFLRGFVSSSAFVQSDAFGFGNGQNAQWVRAAQVGGSDRVLGADVRNTRLALQVPHSELSGNLKAGGVIEIDFFGGFNGTGALSDEQPLPRLRSAYAELVRGRTTLRAGQSFTPVFGNVPVSVTHLAFPLGYGSAGVIGFRSPGLFLFQDVTARTAPVRAAVQLAAFRGSWAGPGDLTDHGSAAEAAAVPQLEARVDLAGGSAKTTAWSLYVAGHYDEKAFTRDGVTDILPGRAVAAGARVDHGRLTLHGAMYEGRAIGQQMGQLAQYGDIRGGGAWLQGGARLGRGWSVWVFGGQDDPDDADVLAHVSGDARLRNRLGAISTQIAIGDYTAGVQWLRASTDWGNRGEAGDRQWNRSADQLSLSVVYRFSTERKAAGVAARQ